ncbi:hypothetical protein Pan241w_22300 [Gimesia alba]|uniref:Uncharacterized protein n=1 Tax=Gimesia alba TaxID=2527973 RepID=A0A517RE52_9PLAN|nr:hypothetical protein [Gimesia alba]QDT42149.1 hypothetical protein Pan241w_22300 [Gimesia alba]
MRSAIRISQFQFEAARDAILRVQVRDCVLREADFQWNDSTTCRALKAARITGEWDAETALQRTGQKVRIGARKRTPETTIFRHQILHGQHDLQHRITVAMRAHAERVEVQQQNTINVPLRGPSAREQRTLYEREFQSQNPGH